MHSLYCCRSQRPLARRDMTVMGHCMVGNKENVRMWVAKLGTVPSKQRTGVI